VKGFFVLILRESSLSRSRKTKKPIFCLAKKVLILQRFIPRSALANLEI
jgi:hypothetical protein